MQAVSPLGNVRFEASFGESPQMELSGEGTRVDLTTSADSR
jgi:hypothetical protein